MRVPVLEPLGATGGVGPWGQAGRGRGRVRRFGRREGKGTGWARPWGHRTGWWGRSGWDRRREGSLLPDQMARMLNY